MKKVLYKVAADSGSTSQMEYSIIESMTLDTDVYGVEIRMLTNENVPCVTASINDIFTNADECRNFIALLAQSCTSPIHLHDITEDFLC